MNIHINLYHLISIRVTYEDLEFTVRDMHDSSDPRVSKFIKLLTKNVRSFCLKEFFYSTIDANYYHENEFIACLGTYMYTQL
jgi:F0F1-type ATP synthase delta subunit